MAKLYFYYSAMNAGKSTTLLQSNYNYQERGMRTLLFCPKLDKRSGEAQISSRIGLAAKANLFDETTDLFLNVRAAHRHQSVDCVLVDEAQFLSAKQVLQLTLICDQIGIPVLCYGLRTDFRGEPFPGSMYLLAWAEELIEIKTVCYSGKKATMNARIDASGQQVVEGNQVDIGHHYISLSRKEFNLDKLSPIDYVVPAESQEWAEGSFVYGEPTTSLPGTMAPDVPGDVRLTDQD